MLQRLLEWAGANCVAHSSRRNAAGDAELYLQCRDARTSKSFKMVVRALFQNWKVPLENVRGDWVQLLSSDDFAAAVGRQALTEAPEEAVTITRLPEGFAERSHELLHQLRCQSRW